MLSHTYLKEPQNSTNILGNICNSEVILKANAKCQRKRILKYAPETNWDQ